MQLKKEGEALCGITANESQYQVSVELFYPQYGLTECCKMEHMGVLNKQ